MEEKRKNKRMIYTLPMPPSINATYRSGLGNRWYKAPSARSWESLAWGEIMASSRLKTILGGVSVEITMYCKRDRDIDNGIKIVLDLLEKAKVIKNDRQVVSLYVYKKHDPESPRCEVEVTELRNL